MDEQSVEDQTLGEISERFREFAESVTSRAPLYHQLARGVADDPATARLLLHAPPQQRLPVLLFACVHWLLLTEPDHDLRRFYPNLVDDVDPADPYPAFRHFCAIQEPRLAGLLASRTTQTNEVGRCAVLLPALSMIEREVSGDVALVDVGTSAGLTLGLIHYEYRFEPGGTVGGPSPVLLECGTRGPVPVPSELPACPTRIGLDVAPIDVDDPAAIGWLEACIWPDQADRINRFRAAVAVARDHPPDVRQGDAVQEVTGLVLEAAAAGHPVVTTTWMLNYLSTDDQRAFLAALDRAGESCDLSWLLAEQPSSVGGVPIPAPDGSDHLTHLVLFRWRSSQRSVQHLGTAHPHGYWLHWDQT